MAGVTDTQPHSGHQQHPEPRLTERRLGRGWNAGCGYCEGLEGRWGGGVWTCILKSAYEYKKKEKKKEKKKKGSGLGKNEQDDFCIPVLYSFLQ